MEAVVQGARGFGDSEKYAPEVCCLPDVLDGLGVLVGARAAALGAVLAEQPGRTPAALKQVRVVRAAAAVGVPGQRGGGGAV